MCGSSMFCRGKTLQDLFPFMLSIVSVDQHVQGETTNVFHETLNLPKHLYLYSVYFFIII